jgi:hypothetical protein
MKGAVFNSFPLTGMETISRGWKLSPSAEIPAFLVEVCLTLVSKQSHLALSGYADVALSRLKTKNPVVMTGLLWGYIPLVIYRSYL